MTRKLFLLLGAFAITAMLSTGTAMAAWGGDDGHGDASGGATSMGEMMGALGLDDAQWAKFNSLRREYRKQSITLQAKIDIAEVELEQLADSSAMDMKAIAAKINDIAKLQAELRAFRYQTLADMRGFISAEQFDTFRWMAMKMGFDFSDDKKGGHGH
ncbi:MAG: periplasmic heavy metal sensor [Nitrospirae bacterium]|nr:periplasmic heavy metal sensor [Nitrospirota bacterium]